MAKKVLRKTAAPKTDVVSETPALKSLPKVNLSKVFDVFKKLNTNQLLVILLVLAAFLIGVLVTKVQYLEKNQGTAAVPPTQAPNQQAQQGLQPGQKVDVKVGKLPALGKDNAKVTVIEFADFQCPFCGKWFTESEGNLIKDYVNTGKVKFYYRHFAFLGQESNWAAEASECANDQGKFWEYHDYLFSNQKGENQGQFSKDNLKKFAATLGLNTTDFNNCVDTDKYAKKITDAVAYGQGVGVSGTPATFINGQMVSGAVSYSQFKTTVEAELTK